MEGIICFLRLLMVVILTCLLALDQSGNHGAPSQSHRGDMEKYQRRADNKTRGEEHFLSLHFAVAWLQVSLVTLTLLFYEMGTDVPASAA